MPIVSTKRGQLTISGFAPGLQGTSLVTGTGALTITGFAPTVARVSKTVTPAVGQVTITGYDPSVVKNQMIPGTGMLTVTGYAPSVLRISGVVPRVLEMPGGILGDTFYININGVFYPLPIPVDWASIPYVLGIVAGVPAWVVATFSGNAILSPALGVLTLTGF